MFNFLGGVQRSARKVLANTEACLMELSLYDIKAADLSEGPHIFHLMLTPAQSPSELDEPRC